MLPTASALFCDEGGPSDSEKPRSALTRQPFVTNPPDNPRAKAGEHRQNDQLNRLLTRKGPLKTSEQLRMRDHWDDRLVGLESVLLGERNLAQQTLEIVVFGYSTSQEAESALRRQMDELIQL